ncbi:MAG: tRNA (adenosine(37)-N6)-threonylcarbamoyltransferase complex ATPase subunit type 1 TsaE [Gammaproteobacteria bacterium]|nr:tRNA (adenosine(37)-N6)-threonylcarbamoyltransferase complex ATPase subunit type 1 TsaE [Gammaproteobacteria bacterium]
MRRYCEDAAATSALAARIAPHLRPGWQLHLSGDLGAGKTTFVRGLLRALGFHGPVPSPSYTLVETYELAEQQYVHLDLYRLVDAEELENLGIRDLVDGRKICLVEWPERAEELLGPPDLMIRFEYVNSAREVQLEAGSREAKALLDRIS